MCDGAKHLDLPMQRRDAQGMALRQGEMTHRHLLWTHESWSQEQGATAAVGRLAQSHSNEGTVVQHNLRLRFGPASSSEST